MEKNGVGGNTTSGAIEKLLTKVSKLIVGYSCSCCSHKDKCGKKHWKDDKQR
ncbi:MULTISPECIES: hypothetical protein [Methanothermococcus]|uniref:hypothetical protein n=1 Tax=Methanothermococcus TaxID=155862 RepID=UPI00037D3282|nr:MULTISPECIES: hypothetical protein [Methanothermococcus]